MKIIDYKEDTPDKVKEILEKCMQDRTRITLDYGDTETGKSWGEVYDISGYVGRSTGEKPILLLVNNSRSSGGGAIMTNRILSIKTSKGKQILYQL